VGASTGFARTFWDERNRRSVTEILGRPVYSTRDRASDGL
jgi:hypothetical protein